MELASLLVIDGIIGAVLGFLVWRHKGQSRTVGVIVGFLLFALLPVIGWVILLLIAVMWQPQWAPVNAQHAPGGPFCEGCGVGVRPEQVPYCTECRNERGLPLEGPIHQMPR